MKIRISRYLLIFASLACLAEPGARATLGEPVDSIEGDRAALAGVKRAAISRTNYTVHEIVSDATTVREYVNSVGVVFGLAWSGMAHPDLSSLLGSYSGDYQRALAANPRQKGHRFHTAKNERIVVEKWGHMRSLQGRAYDPSLLPAGVSADDIK